MKRVFLLSLGLLIGMAGFAQVKGTRSEMAKQNVLTQKVTNDGSEVVPATSYAPANVLPSASNVSLTRGVEATLTSTMTTNYDLQSNSAIGNRIAAWSDGSAAFTATWDYSGSTSYPNRGTGYNYFDGESFGEEPSARVEDTRSGWPSICAYGDGELLASHATGTNLYYRETKGEGDWTLLHTFNIANDGRDWTWPRIGVTTDGTNSAIHIIFADQATDAQNNNVNYIAYYRSTDGGQTWTENPAFAALSEEYNLNIGADDYVMATNGNRIAVTFFSVTYDLFYMYSDNGGETWEKNMICVNPFKAAQGENFSWYQETVSDATDSVYWNDNSGSIAIGNDGTVHVTWAIGRWAPAPDSGFGYLSYWPFVIGCVYWNSNFENEQGTHVIPAWGDWSGDAEFQDEFVWPGQVLGGHGHTMDTDRIEEMAAAIGNGNLHFYGYASEATPNSEDGPAYDNDTWGNRWGSYRTYNGLATMPSIAVDDENNIAILYSGLSDSRTGATAAGTSFYYRSPFLHRMCDGVWEDWYQASIIAQGIQHREEEAYSFCAYPNEVNGNLFFSYSADEEFGLVLDEDQQSLTDNTIYAVRLTSWLAIDETKDVVYNIYPNPATDYICISSDSNADATITFVNLAGQTVKSINKNLIAGVNSINIDLESGVYFCTVTANGYSRTTKVVVK